MNKSDLVTHPGYQKYRLGYNGNCRGIFPRYLARPESSEDVALAVKCAAKHGLKLSVRSGGNDYRCRYLPEDGFHLDLREMDGVEFSVPEEATAVRLLEPEKVQILGRFWAFI